MNFTMNRMYSRARILFKCFIIMNKYFNNMWIGVLHPLNSIMKNISLIGVSIGTF